MYRIEEIAKKAGVSTATVSRVINNKGYVSEETKIKVLKVVNELGYRPKRSAVLFAKQRRKYRVSICISERINKLMKEGDGEQFYGIIIKSIEQISVECGFNINLCLMEDMKNESDGYILLGADVTPEIIHRLKRWNKPFVLVDHYIPGERVDCVVTDGYDGSFYAVNYLIRKGLRKIYHIHGPLTPYGFRSRYEGYTTAMHMAGLEPVYFDCEDKKEKIPEIIDEVLKDKPQAIFTSNDMIAIWVIEELKRRGIKIPEEISIIGFDDIPKAKQISPKLTTLRIFKFEMGDHACKRLHDLLVGHNVHPIRISLFTKFVKRESSI